MFSFRRSSNLQDNWETNLESFCKKKGQHQQVVFQGFKDKSLGCIHVWKLQVWKLNDQNWFNMIFLTKISDKFYWHRHWWFSSATNLRDRYLKVQRQTSFKSKITLDIAGHPVYNKHICCRLLCLSVRERRRGVPLFSQLIDIKIRNTSSGYTYFLRF